MHTPTHIAGNNIKSVQEFYIVGTITTSMLHTDEDNGACEVPCPKSQNWFVIGLEFKPRQYEFRSVLLTSIIMPQWTQ